MHEHVLSPDPVIIRYGPDVRFRWTCTGLAIDVGENLSPSVVEAQCAWRATKPLALEMPQQIEHGWRPWATHAPNGPTHSNGL
jgi:hypothetical protein